MLNFKPISDPFLSVPFPPFPFLLSPPFPLTVTMKNSFAAMSFSKPTTQDAPVGGYLPYAITVNMKVVGTLGNEDSIVVESPAPAVAKSAPAAVPFGLLALDRHAHLNVLAYL